jgi:hypothetical protein
LYRSTSSRSRLIRSLSEDGWCITPLSRSLPEGGR